MCHFLQTVQQYTVTLVARDRGAPQLTNMTSITISLDDLNEFPPVFTQDLYMFSTVYTTSIGELSQQPLTIALSAMQITVKPPLKGVPSLENIFVCMTHTVVLSTWLI